MLRDNFFYILLGFIAIILIGVTIGLQLMLLSGRSADEPSVTNSVSVAQPAAAENVNAASASDEQAVAMVINTPTSTPIVIAVEPADSSAASAPVPVEATSTAVQPTALPPTVPPVPTEPAPAEPAPAEPAPAEPAPVEPAPAEPAPTEPAPTEPQPVEPQPAEPQPAEPQPAEVSASDTEPAPTEAIPPTPIPSTATPVIVEPTSTPFLATDFVLGYVDGRSECALVTNIVGDLLETWGWSTRLVRFASITDIFDVTLYQDDNAMRPDLTFCYRDPEDREQFLSQNGTDLELISSGYTQIDTQKYYILAHSSIPVQLRYENACVLNFLKNLELSDTSLDASSSSQWFAENAVLVESWGTCASEER